VIVGLAVAAILFGLDLQHGNLLLLGLCVLVISFTTAGLGLLFGSIGLIMRDAIIIANVVYYLLLVVCGINFPVSRLPEVIQFVSYGLPLTRGVRGRARSRRRGLVQSHQRPSRGRSRGWRALRVGRLRALQAAGGVCPARRSSRGLLICAITLAAPAPRARRADR